MRYRSWKKRLTFKGRVSELAYETMCQDSESWSSCALGESLGLDVSRNLGKYIYGYSYNDPREWWWGIPDTTMKELVQRGVDFYHAVRTKEWKRARAELQFISNTVRKYRRKLKREVG